MVGGHKGRVFCAAPAPAQSGFGFATGCEDMALRAYAYVDGRWRVAAERAKAHTEEVLRCSWHARAGQSDGVLSGSGGEVVLASGGADGTVRLWSVQDRTSAVDDAAPLKLEQQDVYELSEQCYVADFDAEAADANALYCASDDILVCIDAAAGSQRYKFRCEAAGSAAYGGAARNPEGAALVFGAAMSPAGSRLRLLALAVSDGSVRLHERSTGGAVGALACAGGAHVTTVAFGGQDGELLAVGCGDGHVEVFDVRHGAGPLATIRGHQRPVYTALWVPTSIPGARRRAGDLLLTASSDFSAKLWDINDAAGEEQTQPLECVRREAFPLLTACVAPRPAAAGGAGAAPAGPGEAVDGGDSCAAAHDSCLVLAGGAESILGVPCYVSALPCTGTEEDLSECSDETDPDAELDDAEGGQPASGSPGGAAVAE